jgi:ribosome-binding factor A
MKEISETILMEVKDPRLLSMVTVLDAVISSDMKHIKVIVSIYGENEKNNQKTFTALKAASGFIGSIVGKNRRFRYTPDIHFERSDSLAKSEDISNLLKELKHDDNEVDSDS